MVFERYSCFSLLLFFISFQTGLGSSSLRDCSRSLGLQDGRILNSQLSSPAHFEHLYIGNGSTASLKPKFARLNNALAWCSPSRRNSDSTYIEIDFKQHVNISGIATQGFMGINAYYVKQYKVAYSIDGVAWEFFKKVLTGNSDTQTIVKNTFNPLISARYFRVYPVTYNYRVCMRIELYGCTNLTMDANPKVPPVVPTPTVTVPSTTTSSLHVTPTLNEEITATSKDSGSVKVAIPTWSSVHVEATNHDPSANKMKETLSTTTVRVPWSVSSQDAVAVAQTDKGVGEKNFLDLEPEGISTSMFVALSAAAFIVIVVVPVIMFLSFLRQRKLKRCACPKSTDYSVPLTTAVIDESLCNQEMYDTYRYGVPTGKCNEVEMNFLNRYAL